MIIIFLITYVAATSTVNCDLQLTGTKTIGTSNGQFTASITTTPDSTSYALVSSDLNWNNDTNQPKIQGDTFACSGCIQTTSTSKIFKCSLSPNSQYTISCQGINTPSYTGTSFGKIYIIFYDSSDKQLASCDQQTLSGFTTGTIIIPTLTPKALVINTSYSILLQIKLATTMQYSNSDMLSVTSTGFTSLTDRSTSDFYYQSGSTTQLVYSVKISDAEILKDIYLSIKLTAVTGPSTKSHTFLIQTFKSSNTYLKDESPTQTFTISGGSLSLTNILVPNKIINNKVLYTITIKLANAVTTTDGYITFPQPNNLSFDATQSCSVFDGTITAKTNVCSQDPTSKLIKISGFSSLSIGAGTSLTITLGFQNPSSASIVSFSTFISYYDQSGSSVDTSSTSQTVSGYNTGTLSNVTVTPEYYQVGILGSISYQFTTINQIKAGSYVNLIIPSEMAWQSSVNQCILTVDSDTPVSCGCSLTLTGTQIAKLSNIFDSLTSSIPESKNVTIQLNQAIRNPYSFRPTTSGGFSLSIFDSSNLAYDSLLNFGQLTMNLQSTITINSCTSNSKKNGDLTSYNLGLNFDTEQPSGTLLTVSFPSFNFGSVTATFDGPTTTVTTSVDSLNGKITVTLPLVTKNTAKNLILQNIYNLDSYAPGALTAASYDGSYPIASTTSACFVQNSEPGAITVDSMTQDNYLLGELDSYSFQLTLFNVLSSGAVIIVTVPTGISINATDCTSYMTNINGFTLSTCSASGQNITLTPSAYTTSKTIQFKFNLLFRNPSAPATISFSVQTQRGTNLVDKTQSTTNLLFTTKCDLPCKTCIDSRTKCLSCYSISITTAIYYNSNYCYDSCDTGYYSDTNNKCQQCTTNCIKCNATTCTDCVSNLYEIVNTKCQLKCNANQYDYNGICTDCDSNCNTCSGTSVTCTSCSGSLMLYSSKCFDKCPTGVFQVGVNCVGCTSPCQTCDTGPQVCASCINNYYLMKSTSKCLTDCGTGYYKNGSICSTCVSPCNNCTGDQVCLDCVANYYYLNNQCLSTISNGYYASGNVLIKCPDTCGNCTSETVCTSCPKSKYLLSGVCNDACPDNYYSVNFVCMACDTSCLQCTSAVVCTKCPDGQFQLAGKCLTSCPVKYYGSTDLQCLSCYSTCATCTNATECVTCPTTNTLYLLNKVCVAACPTNYYLSKTTCVQCSTECATCDSKGCLTCITNYKQLNQTCAATCPTGYQDLKNTGQCEVVTTNDQTVINNLQENKYIPVPFTIVSLVMLLSIAVAKIQKSEVSYYDNQTFIPGAAVGLLGLLVVGSWAVLLILQLDYILQKIETYLLMAALGLHVILNIVNLCVLKKCTKGDQAFLQWYSAKKDNSCAYFMLNTISVLSFSLTRLYFSRYFGFRFLKCKLSNVEEMSGLNTINGLCVLFCCIPACVGAVLLAYRDELREQLFISSIDSFIITIIFAIALIWETQKDESYFEDINYASVSQSHQIIPEFFQSSRSKNSKRFSFEEPSHILNKFNEQEFDQEPSFPKIDESVEYKPEQQFNVSQSEQPVFKMQQKSSQFTFKQELPENSNIQKVTNRSQEEVVLEMPNNEIISPLSIGESLQEVPQPKVTLEQQQAMKQQEEQNRIAKIQEEQQKKLEKEKEEEQKRIEELEEQRKIQAELELKKQLEQQKIQEEQARQLEIQIQEERRKQDEIKKQEEIKRQEEERRQEEIRKEEIRKQEEIRKKEEQQLIEKQRQLEEQERMTTIEKQKAEEERQLMLQKQKEQEQKQAELQKQQEIEKKQQEEKAERERQELQRLEEERQAKLAIEEQRKADDEKRIQEEQRKQEEERVQQERIQQEEETRKQIELQQLQEEQRLQELKEQEMMQRVKQSRESNRNEPSKDIEVMQNEIEDLKLQVEEFEEDDNKLNNIILVDEDDDDVGWDMNEDEDQGIQEGMMVQQKKYQKEIIQDDQNDVDDDWDAPTSGFVSVQPKSQLKRDQQVEEPVNPFKGINQKQQIADSDLFKQSRNDSDEEDWAANQISPSDFNALNQRLEIEKHSITQNNQQKKFSRTGQNFKSGVNKRPTLPDPQINSDDNESIEQQSVFDQFARNQINNIPKKQNKGLDKIYLQRLSKKQQQRGKSGNINMNDIEF